MCKNKPSIPNIAQPSSGVNEDDVHEENPSNIQKTLTGLVSNMHSAKDKYVKPSTSTIVGETYSC